jgi:hypothetical protein
VADLVRPRRFFDELVLDLVVSELCMAQAQAIRDGFLRGSILTLRQLKRCRAPH